MGKSWKRNQEHNTPSHRKSPWGWWCELPNACDCYDCREHTDRVVYPWPAYIDLDQTEDMRE